MILRSVVVSLALVATSVASAEEKGERQCFSREETREHIHAEKLVEPFGIVRKTAGAMKAEALGARLCRTDGMFVYEINLLDRDGRIIHAVVDAATGRPAPQPR